MEGESQVTGPMLLSSDKIDLLVTALVEAQSKMPAVPKTKTNPFFKSKYADLSSVVETVEPVIANVGLAVAQFVSHDGASTTLKTFLMHTSGQWMGDEMVLHLGKSTPQDQGSAITYARRYAYCAALGIVSDDDDDGNAASRSAKSEPSTAKIESKPTTRVQAPPSTTDKPPTMRKLFAIMNGNHSIPKDDDGRHQWATKALGRDVTTFKDLTPEDVKALEKAAKSQVTDSEPEYPPGQEPF